MPSASPDRAVEGRSTRVMWVDTAKGFGIILVVLGHVLRGLVSANVMTWTPTAQFADAWIYAFHMPLFFFLSGLFLFRSTFKAWPTLIWDRFRTIAYPYFIWSVVILVIKAPLGSIVNSPRDLSDIPLILYEPIEQFWFLYVLFLLVVVTGCLMKFGVNVWLNLLFAALLYPGILPIPFFKWVPLDQIRFFAIFLALGTVLGKYGAVETLLRIPGRWLVLTVALGLAISSLPAWHDIRYQYPLQFLAAASGTAAIVALAVLLDRSRWNAVVQFLGRYTLEIYVAHTIVSAAVRIALQHFTDVKSPAIYLLVGTAVGLIIPILFAIALRRTGLPLFTLPKTATAPSTQALGRPPDR